MKSEFESEMPELTPDQLREIRRTALILGELPPEAATEVRRELASATPAEAKHHELLAQTAGLVRDALTQPAGSVDSISPTSEAPLTLSAERREKLLTTFKVIRPSEFTRPTPRRWATRSELGFAAALVAGIVGVTGFLIGSFPSVIRKGSGAAGGERYLFAKDSGEFTTHSASLPDGSPAAPAQAPSRGESRHRWALASKPSLGQEPTDGAAAERESLDESRPPAPPTVRLSIAPDSRQLNAAAGTTLEKSRDSRGTTELQALAATEGDVTANSPVKVEAQAQAQTRALGRIGENRLGEAAGRGGFGRAAKSGRATPAGPAAESDPTLSLTRRYRAALSDSGLGTLKQAQNETAGIAPPSRSARIPVLAERAEDYLAAAKKDLRELSDRPQVLDDLKVTALPQEAPIEQIDASAGKPITLGLAVRPALTPDLDGRNGRADKNPSTEALGFDVASAGQSVPASSLASTPANGVELRAGVALNQLAERGLQELGEQNLYFSYQVQTNRAHLNELVTEANDAERAKKKRAAEAKVAELDGESLHRSPNQPAAPTPQPEVVAAEQPFSTFSLNVSDVSYKLAAASLDRDQIPTPASIRSEEFINAFDYHDPEPAGNAPLAFAQERARYPFAQDREILRFSVKTAATGRQPGRPLNLVLLLDNSGSMERADRVAIIRECLSVLASQLQPQDRISVVTFARTPRLWIDGLEGKDAAQLPERIGSLTPEGGTNLELAMSLAYTTARRHFLEQGINRVVVLTDGAANLGEVQPSRLRSLVEQQRGQGIALDCFGIGWEGYNDDLLESLSRNGDGRYGFVNSPEEAADHFANQLSGALNVAASDVKVQIEFNPRRVTSYRQIGYAKHQLTQQQFRDNTVDAAEIGAAESGNALYVAQVRPEGEGPIATARLRFKKPGTSEYQELAWNVPYDGAARSLDKASPSLRLATTASALSEWLAQSPFAGDISPARLLPYLNGLPEAASSDPRPAQLLRMIQQSQRLTGK